MKIRNNPTINILWKGVIGFLGFFTVICGTLLIPLPGPGLLVVLAGLMILASEFKWAEQYVNTLKLKLNYLELKQAIKNRDITKFTASLPKFTQRFIPKRFK